MTGPYNPGRFSGTYETENGAKLWKILTRPDNILRMETATYLARPAAEPLSPVLLQDYGARAAEDRIKQMTGHMIRQIMEQRGYRVARSNVRIARRGNIFSSATRYEATAAAPQDGGNNA